MGRNLPFHPYQSILLGTCAVWVQHPQREGARMQGTTCQKSALAARCRGWEALPGLLCRIYSLWNRLFPLWWRFPSAILMSITHYFQRSGFYKTNIWISRFIICPIPHRRGNTAVCTCSHSAYLYPAHKFTQTHSREKIVHRNERRWVLLPALNGMVTLYLF